MFAECFPVKVVRHGYAQATGRSCPQYATVYRSACGVVYAVRMPENDTLVGSVAFYFVYVLACRVRACANSVQHNDAIPKNRTG